MSEPWPDRWPSPAELYAASGFRLDDIEDAGYSLAVAGFGGVGFQELEQQARAWRWPLASVVDLLIDTRNAFARARDDTHVV